VTVSFTHDKEDLISIEPHVTHQIALVNCSPVLSLSSKTVRCKFRFQRDFYFMKRSYSLAAVFAVLMTWHALAASALPDPADEFYNNAMGLYEQGRFADALPLAQKLVLVDEQALGPNHLDFAKDLNLLGLLYHQLRHYAEAQTAYE
jgi:tetratricopeptide (TPR) repeat protein